MESPRSKITPVETVRRNEFFTPALVNDTQDMKSEDEYSVKQLFREFVDETSAGGINRIFSTKPVAVRIIWTLFCIMCYGLLIKLCYGLIVEFYNKPTLTFVDVSVEQDIEFPAVTICNMNKFRESQLRSLLPRVHKTIMKFRQNPEAFISDDENDEEESDDNTTNPELTKQRQNQYLKNTYEMSGIEEGEEETSSNLVSLQDILQKIIVHQSKHYRRERLMEAGHQFDKLIAGCEWMGVSCDEGYFEKYWISFWNWNYGNCYTYNFGINSEKLSKQTLRTSKAGPDNGLLLNIFLEQHDYIPELSHEAGVKIVIGPQKQYPYPFNEGIDVSPGTTTSIALRKEQIDKVDQFGNLSCMPENKITDNLYNEDGVVLKYSVQTCLDTCLVEHQKEECNCTDPMYWSSASDVCRTMDQRQCIFVVERKTKNDSYGCNKRCPQSCSSVTYRTTISQAQISVKYQQQIKNQLLQSPKYREHLSKDPSAFDKGFLRVKIYFEELNLIRIRQKFSYPAQNVLADIGGQLGLWVGISVITFAELGDLIISLVLLTFRKR